MSRLMVYFLMVPYSSNNGMWNSINMRSNGCTMRHSPTNWCPPPPPVMALPPPTAPASAPSARLWRSSSCLAAPTTPAILSHQESYCPTTLSRSPLTISLPCSRPPPPVGGSTAPLMSLTQPLEHSPCHSVIFESMGGEYTPMAWPTMPSEGSPQTSCPSSLAQPSLPACLMTHLLLSNPPPPPTGWGGCSPTHTLLTVGESAPLAARRAIHQGLQRLHTLCPPWDMLMHIHGGWMPSTLSPSSSSIGINDTLFVNTWHSKSGIASPQQQSSAGNGASGLIAGLPSRPYIARSVSACSCYVTAHRCTPCRFGVIANHLQHRPTKPLTQKSSVIPSGIVVCHYHDGGKHGVKLIAVTARVGGFGPTLRRTEGGRCACLFVFGLHSLLWQHWNYALEPGGHCFHPTSHPTQLPQLFNACTAPTLIRLIRSGNGGCSCSWPGTN